MDVSVVVGTFGDESWVELAHERAIPSVESQGVEVVHFHGETLDTYGASLAQCRNRGVAQADSEWVCVLDADDELRPGFFEAMEAAAAAATAAGGDLLTPAVEYVREGRVRPAMFWPERPLTEGNWLIVSTLLRREMFFRAGAYRDVLLYEDWDLFQRCAKLGATIEKVPDAICRVHINLDSKHRHGTTQQEKRAAHDQVLRLNHPELFEEAA